MKISTVLLQDRLKSKLKIVNGHWLRFGRNLRNYKTNSLLQFFEILRLQTVFNPGLKVTPQPEVTRFPNPNHRTNLELILYVMLLHCQRLQEALFTEWYNLKDGCKLLSIIYLAYRMHHLRIKVCSYFKRNSQV